MTPVPVPPRILRLGAGCWAFRIGSVFAWMLLTGCHMIAKQDTRTVLVGIGVLGGSSQPAIRPSLLVTGRRAAASVRSAPLRGEGKGSRAAPTWASHLHPSPSLHRSILSYPHCDTAHPSCTAPNSLRVSIHTLPQRRVLFKSSSPTATNIRPLDLARLP